MKWILALPFALALSGCALSVKLLEDGKVHAGSFDVASSTMEATVDGDVFRGPLIRGMSTGFITGTAGARFYSSNVIIASNNFQAVLTNSAGKVMRCQFQSALGRGVGVCQMNDGRILDLVQGS
jgi:hypothetical protein